MSALARNWRYGGRALRDLFALDLPVDVVKMTIHAISDKGIIFLAGEEDTDGYAVLPLTRDFLSSKWNESDGLRRKVEERFARMFSSDAREGFLLNWPVDRRVELGLDQIADRSHHGLRMDAILAAPDQLASRQHIPLSRADRARASASMQAAMLFNSPPLIG